MKIVKIITSLSGVLSQIASTSFKALAKSATPAGEVPGVTLDNGNLLSTKSSVFFSPVILSVVSSGL